MISVVAKQVRLAFFAIFTLASLIGVGGIAKAAENWPLSYTPRPEWMVEINELFDGSLGKFHDTGHERFIQDYKPLGDYLNYSENGWGNDGTVVMKDGMPMIREGDQIYWNPCSLAQYALHLHSKFIKGDDMARKKFLAVTDFLISLQSKDGSFRYKLTYDHRGTILAPGWVSGISQGNALSVFARAFEITNNPRYRVAGEKTFAFLMKPYVEGGLRTSLADLDPSLSGYVFFPEYPTKPIRYTLNGYIFTLFGIYDWAHIQSNSRQQAQEIFDAGIESLEHILHYYDIAGHSAYDLGHIVLKDKPWLPFDYQGVHVYLLHALSSVVERPIFKHYETIWADKIDNMNAQVRLDGIKYSKDKPLKVGRKVKFSVNASGGKWKPKLFQFAVKYGSDWAIPQPYSRKSTFEWAPNQSGQYVIGFYVKDQGSNQEYDNFQYRSIEVNK